MRSSLTNVPLLEPRSSTCNVPSLATTMRAWWADTDGNAAASNASPFVGERPRVSTVSSGTRAGTPGAWTGFRDHSGKGMGIAGRS